MRRNTYTPGVIPMVEMWLAASLLTMTRPVTSIICTMPSPVMIMLPLLMKAKVPSPSVFPLSDMKMVLLV